MLSSGSSPFKLSPMVATAAKGSTKSLILLVGGPERTRTSDLRFRKPLLYPAELRDRISTRRYSISGRAGIQVRRSTAAFRPFA
jgi:hypothetical protein